MCGIAGIFAYRSAANAIDRSELLRIREHMAARGPDGFGEWISGDARIGLAHRRLSILDLTERAAQPMRSTDGRHVIVFNGEIYNFRKLRAELEGAGRTFRTESDTEVLLQLYAVRGPAMVKSLRGMFTFAIWDEEKRGVLLARDPCGIKPLYYANTGGTLRFASQVKALLAGGVLSSEPDAAGWVGFHLFGSVPEPYTTTRAIRSLEAGSTLWIDTQGVDEPIRFLNIAEIYHRAEEATLKLSSEELKDYLHDALLDSVRHHMVSDVPVGIFLSAGIDSGCLLGLMRDVGQQDIEAVTLGFDEFQTLREDEVPLAKECAARYGSRHTVRMVTEKEFQDELPRIFMAMDQPTIDGINTWFVAKAAHELGLKAAMSGLGGDELFGGYPSFHDIPRWVRLCSVLSRVPKLGDAFQQFADAFQLEGVLNPKIAGLIKYGGTYEGAYFLRRGLFMPWELSRLMDEDFAAEGLRQLAPLSHIARMLGPVPQSSFARIAVLEATLYMRNQLLRDTDWASMAHSIEVRVPLVDAKLLETVAPVLLASPKSRWKRHLASAPRMPLPKRVVSRAKTGFTTPIEAWLQKNEKLQEWRRIPKLAREGCHWSRRWAYQLAAA
jgi:asparagine synthase (glutamine-hydrolysing)